MKADGLMVMIDGYQMILFVFFPSHNFVWLFEVFFYQQGIIFLPSFYIKQEASTILQGTVSHPHNHIYLAGVHCTNGIERPVLSSEL